MRFCSTLRLDEIVQGLAKHCLQFYFKHCQCMSIIQSVNCVNLCFADNMANDGQRAMNEMLRRLNLPLICRRKVDVWGSCFYDREESQKACVTSFL